MQASILTEDPALLQVTIPGNYSLWWPIGFGEQVLYNFTLTYTSHNNDTDMLSESSLSRRLGIRRMELVEEPLRDPAGFSFYFRVNGVPIYARGAVYIFEVVLYPEKICLIALGESSSNACQLLTNFQNKNIVTTVLLLQMLGYGILTQAYRSCSKSDINEVINHHWEEEDTAWEVSE